MEENKTSSIEKIWDSFFFSEDNISNDFMNERDAGYQNERESFNECQEIDKK